MEPVTPPPSSPPAAACKTPKCLAKRVTVWLLVITAAVAGAYLLDRWRLASAKDLVPWVQTLDEGQALAQQTGKPMLINYTSAWCGYCIQMKADVFAKPDAADQIAEHYVPIKLDADRLDEPALLLAQRLDVTYLPTYAILSPRGDVIAMRSGYIAKPDMLQWLADNEVRALAIADPAAD